MQTNQTMTVTIGHNVFNIDHKTMMGNLNQFWDCGNAYRIEKGVGLLAAAHLVGLNAWAWQERDALAAKQAGVRNALTQTFPKVQVVVDAPVQMERELAVLRQAAGSVSPRDLEPLLAAAGAALPEGQLPNALEYTAGELRLRGITLTDEEHTAMVTRLQTAGYGARMDDGSLSLRAETTP